MALRGVGKRIGHAEATMALKGARTSNARRAVSSGARRRTVLHAGDVTHRGMAGLSKFRGIRTPPVTPSGGRNRAVTNKILAHKGRIVAGGIVAAGGAGIMTRRRSGLDRVKGRPTGPYVY